MGNRFLVGLGTALFIGTLAVVGCGKKEEPAPPPPAPEAPASEPGAMAPAPEMAPETPAGAMEEKKEEGAKAQ